MERLLAATRELFEQQRHAWLFFWKSYNRITRPDWARGRDTPFECIYQDYKRLLRRGEVVWGHIVQANTLLFKPGPDDCPAAAVFSLDPHFDDNLDELEHMARALFDLKRAEEYDKEVADFARAITNEYEVLFNRKLPKSVASGRTVYYTTIMVHRKHLPARSLKAGWFPLVVLPKESPASLILPSRYWDANLVRQWKKG
jgi:hypothetical protein